MTKDTQGWAIRATLVDPLQTPRSHPCPGAWPRPGGMQAGMTEVPPSPRLSSQGSPHLPLFLESNSEARTELVLQVLEPGKEGTC